MDAISTRWTLLREAHGQDTAANAARGTLLMRYLPAIRRYIGALVRDEGEADDLAHDVGVRLLAGDFAGADPNRGRFRDLLKVAVRNMVRNHWARGNRRKTAAYDLNALADQNDDVEDDRWLVEWRQGVLDQAWSALERQQAQRAGNVDYTLLRLRADHPDDSSDQLAERLSRQLGEPIRPDAVRQKLRRARLRLVDLLIAEVAKGLNDPSPEKIEDELVALGLLEYLRELLPADWNRDD